MVNEEEKERKRQLIFSLLVFLLSIPVFSLIVFFKDTSTVGVNCNSWTLDKEGNTINRNQSETKTKYDLSYPFSVKKNFIVNLDVTTCDNKTGHNYEYAFSTNARNSLYAKFTVGVAVAAATTSLVHLLLTIFARDYYEEHSCYGCLFGVSLVGLTIGWLLVVILWWITLSNIKAEVETGNPISLCQSLDHASRRGQTDNQRVEFKCKALTEAAAGQLSSSLYLSGIIFVRYMIGPCLMCNCRTRQVIVESQSGVIVTQTTTTTVYRSF